MFQYRYATSRLTLAALLTGGLMYATGAWAATPTLDDIRPDATQYGMWTAKFQACGDFFHEDEGIALQNYDGAFNERVRQDLASQTHNVRFDFESGSKDPGVVSYLKHLRTVVDDASKQGLIDFPVSPAACQKMEQNFVAYYGPFVERVKASMPASQ